MLISDADIRGYDLSEFVAKTFRYIALTRMSLVKPFDGQEAKASDCFCSALWQLLHKKIIYR